MKRFPWRLVFVLVVLVLASVFASLNRQAVDVSVVFYVFKSVPLFLALIFAFIAGALCVLPFALAPRRPRLGSGDPGTVHGPAGNASPRA
jgi:uncharacterized integral membrane protein